MIRLAAFDLDDTLLNEKGRLSERSVQAVKAARAAEIKVTIATGRMPAASFPFAEKLGIDIPLICYNGALIIDSKREYLKTELDKDLTLDILRFAESEGFYIQFFDETGYYYAHRSSFSRLYGSRIGIAGNETGIQLSQWADHGAIKLLCVTEENRRAELCDIMKARFGGFANVMATRSNYVEIVSPAADKGRAFISLCGMLGTDTAEAAAFGDAENDIPMIRAAGKGVCMLNGCDKAREAADIIAPPNTMDGAARVLEDLIRMNGEGK